MAQARDPVTGKFIKAGSGANKAAEQAAEKTVTEFTSALQKFTKNVSSGVEKAKEKASDFAGSDIGKKLNERRREANLDSESMVNAAFDESPIMKAMAGGTVDVVKNKLFGKEDEEDNKAQKETAENTKKIADSLEDSKLKEEEERREQKSFWEKLLGKGGDDDSQIERVEDESGMGWAVLGGALLFGLAAWLTSEGDFNNVFSGWTAALKRTNTKLATMADDVGKKLASLTDDVAKNLDNFGKGVATKFNGWKSKLFGPESIDEIAGATDEIAGASDDVLRSTDDAARAADDIIPTKAVADVGDDVVKVADDAASNIGKFSKVAKVVNRAALPLAIAVDTVFAAKDVHAAGALEEAGKITEDQMTDYVIERTSGAAGSIGGGLAGAAVGATVGSVIPVVGTLLGGIAGGVAGAWLGEEGMTALAEAFTGGSGVDEVLEKAEEEGTASGWGDMFGFGDDADTQPDVRSMAASTMQDAALGGAAGGSGGVVVNNISQTTNEGGKSTLALPPPSMASDPSLAAPAQ